jgi:hypothetical protein
MLARTVPPTFRTRETELAPNGIPRRAPTGTGPAVNSGISASGVTNGS